MENEYILRINQAMDFIYQNLDRNLTVEEIADYCCFSKYYFNRVFRSVAGDSIYAFIKRLKLESAAFKLRTTRRPITAIATEIGYSPSNFASAFKEYFGVSASDYRKDSDIPSKDSYRFVMEQIRSLKMRDDFFHAVDARMTIKKIPAMVLEYRRFIGNYLVGLKPEWEIFCRNMEQKYGLDETTQFIGISYDNPLIADENRCIYDMCIRVRKAGGVNIHRVESGYYACCGFHDKLENLMQSYQEIFSLWLPFAAYELDDRFGLEVYHSGLDAEGRIGLDICIPIKDPK